MAKMAFLHGVKFLPVNIDDALQKVIEHIPNKSGDYFCFSNIHLVMECHKNEDLKKIVNNSTANFPDGMGTVGALKMLDSTFKNRVRGTDLMLGLCAYAAQRNLRIFLYGNTEDTLDILDEKLRLLFPGITIAGMLSPPFRELTDEEEEIAVDTINQASPDILFVSLGAPKQEIWMAKHFGRIKAVQLGVGAAFDFIAQKVKQAPTWMQNAYMEWLYRLPQQPKKTISRMTLVPEFLLLLSRQYIRKKLLGQKE
jgi:N-acetylglucosaminyldiphosphoundecaprenol N-acetyl-beta-D-mannosaminyltransferase